MLRTAIACVALACLSFAAAQWVTRDFQVWTAEGARRLDVALNPRPAPRLAMEGLGVKGQTLEALLSENGMPTIVDFMYTRCESVCTALGSVFQQLQADIVREGEGSAAVPVRLLSISFDARYDDAAVLAAYASRLQADSRVWRFARTAAATDTEPMLDHFQVTVIPDGLGGYEHNAALLVMDSRGRLVRVFDYAEMEIALAFARSLPAVRNTP